MYTVYKITNQINGKCYIGCHKTEDLDDDYMGSGKHLKRSQTKYGIHNFTKEILFVFSSATEMYNKEAEIVNECFILEKSNYNIKVGGLGGWDHVNSNDDILVLRNTKCSHKRVEKLRTDPEYREFICNIISIAAKTRKPLCEDDMHKKREHARKALSVAKEVNKTKKWITNGVENKKISKSEPIPVGWTSGRVGNFVNKKYQ